MKFSGFGIFVLFALLPCFQCVIPGGHEEIPVDDPEIIRLSEIAMVNLNKAAVAGEQKTLVEIVSARRQIVSGTLTTLTLNITSGGNPDTCEVEIWEQPWLNKTEVTVKKCGGASSSKKKRQLAPEQAVNKNE